MTRAGKVNRNNSHFKRPVVIFKNGGYMKRFIIAAATFITAALYGFSDDKPVQIAFEAESGALKVLYHTYRVGAGSSTFRYPGWAGNTVPL